MTSRHPEDESPNPRRSRGTHVVALLAALFAVPLLISGAQVTTNRVGMAVPDWPTTFGVNMFLYNFFEAPLGVVIEHRHRLFGSGLGILAIILAVWSLAADRRRWVKLMGLVTLLAVTTQGVLGGFRVLRNSTTFAAIHGSTGQAVFALLVAMCVFTGRDWADDATSTDSQSLRRRSLVNLFLVYGQIVIGATLRHFGANLVLHAVIAAAVYGHVALFCWRVHRVRSDVPSLVGPARWMAIAVTLQVVLGVAAWWLLRPFDGIPRPVSRIQAIIRSGHVVNGAILLASCVVATLRSFRHLSAPEAAPSKAVASRPVEALA